MSHWGLEGWAPIDLPKSGPEPFEGYGVPGSLRWCLHRARDYLQPDQMAKVGSEIALSRARTASEFIRQALEEID